MNQKLPKLKKVIFSASEEAFCCKKHLVRRIHRRMRSKYESETVELERSERMLTEKYNQTKVRPTGWLHAMLGGQITY